jgi:hypothetical protein
MGTLLRAVFGIAIALAVYAPDRFMSVFDTPRLAAVKADLAATHPGADLWRMIGNELKRLPEEESNSRRR